MPPGILQLRQVMMEEVRYQAYGLTIQSDLALPELSVAEDSPAAPELVIEEAGESIPSVNDDQVYYQVLSANDVTVLWRPAGSIRAIGGKRLAYSRAAEASELLFRLFVINQ